MVVSLLHHFLETYVVGVEHLELHAENCSDQNKNNHMMRYLMWHVTTGLHKSGLGLWPAAEEDEEDIAVIAVTSLPASVSWWPDTPSSP